VNGLRVIGAGRYKFIAKSSKNHSRNVLSPMQKCTTRKKVAGQENQFLQCAQALASKPALEQRQKSFSASSRQLSFGGAFQWQIGMRFCCRF
jgi:hypothetical protein